MHEDGFREIEFSGNGLFLALAQCLRLIFREENDGQGVAAIGICREDVESDEGELSHDFSEYLGRVNNS